MTKREMNQADGERLIIFLKAPRPGTVKTRLAQTLSPEGACVIYRKLVEVLLDHLAPLSNVQLRFTPDDVALEVAPWLRSTWMARPQGPGDLGQRLQRAFAEAFSSGARRVLIIGSDCPEVTVRDIESAWIALEDHDLALGPARDGGYWLIGLRALQPRLFEGIPWGACEVLKQTLDIAASMPCRVHLLPVLSDVDTAEDWREFLAKRPGVFS